MDRGAARTTAGWSLPDLPFAGLATGTLRPPAPFRVLLQGGQTIQGKPFSFSFCFRIGRSSACTEIRCPSADLEWSHKCHIWYRSCHHRSASFCTYGEGRIELTFREICDKHKMREAAALS